MSSITNVAMPSELEAELALGGWAELSGERLMGGVGAAQFNGDSS